MEASHVIAMPIGEHNPWLESGWYDFATSHLQF